MPSQLTPRVNQEAPALAAVEDLQRVRPDDDQRRERDIVCTKSSANRPTVQLDSVIAGGALRARRGAHDRDTAVSASSS